MRWVRGWKRGVGRGVRGQQMCVDIKSRPQSFKGVSWGKGSTRRTIAVLIEEIESSAEVLALIFGQIVRLGNKLVLGHSLKFIFFAFLYLHLANSLLRLQSSRYYQHYCHTMIVFSWQMWPGMTRISKSLGADQAVQNSKWKIHLRTPFEKNLSNERSRISLFRNASSNYIEIWTLFPRLFASHLSSYFFSRIWSPALLISPNHIVLLQRTCGARTILADWKAWNWIKCKMKLCASPPI